MMVSDRQAFTQEAVGDFQPALPENQLATLPVSDPFDAEGRPAKLLLRADRPTELVLEGESDLIADSFALAVTGGSKLEESQVKNLDRLADRAPNPDTDKPELPRWARRVAVSIGDDTPLQVLPAVFRPGVTSTTRNLAAALNAAWVAAAARAAGGTVRVPIRLLSIEDGRIEVEITGRFRRIREAAPVSLRLDPWRRAELEVPSPADGARVELELDAAFEPGIRQRLLTAVGTSPGQRFRVRVDAHLHASQSFRLAAAGTPPGLARELNAVWVCLPQVPTAAANLTVAISAEIDAAQTVASFEVEVPADAAALLPDPNGAGLWFRAVAPAPILLDASLAVAQLRVELSSRGAGVELVHRVSPPLPSDVRGLGNADVRRLAAGPAWRPRRFQAHPTQLLCDLELVGLPKELERALELDDGTALPLPGLRFTRYAVTVPAEAAPAAVTSGVRRLGLRSRLSGEVTLSARSVLSADPPRIVGGRPIFDAKEVDDFNRAVASTF